MLSDPAAADAGFSRSSAGVALLVGFAEARGLSARRALAGTGLDVGDLARRGVSVTAAQELRVIRTLRAAFGEVGSDVGVRYRLSTFGPLGYAMGSGRTLADAVDVALRFIDLSFTFAIPRADVVGGRVVVTVDGSGLPDDVRRFCVDRDVTAIHTVLDALLPGGVGATVRRGVPRAELSFDAAELARPLPRSGERSLAAAEALCDAVVATRRDRTGLAHDVRVLVTQTLPEGAPMSAVADALGVSVRTLRRRLDVEGASYQGLLDEVRRSLATGLLDGRSTMPVAEVATRLGYSGATAFIAAHRRWTGRTPTGR